MQPQQTKIQKSPSGHQDVSDCGGGICADESTNRIGNHGSNDGPGTDMVLGTTANTCLKSFHDGNDSPYPGQVPATQIHCTLGALMAH